MIESLRRAMPAAVCKMDDGKEDRGPPDEFDELYETLPEASKGHVARVMQSVQKEADGVVKKARSKLRMKMEKVSTSDFELEDGGDEEVGQDAVGKRIDRVNTAVDEAAEKYKDAA
eukprot:4084437-Prymnesium_polylepis.1